MATVTIATPAPLGCVLLTAQRILARRHLHIGGRRLAMKLGLDMGAENKQKKQGRAMVASYRELLLGRVVYMLICSLQSWPLSCWSL